MHKICSFLEFKQLLDQSERFQLCNVSTCGASCWIFLNKSKKSRQILVLNPFLNFRLIVELKFEESPVLCLRDRASSSMLTGPAEMVRCCFGHSPVGGGDKER